MSIVDYVPTAILTPLLVDVLLLCIVVIKIAIIAVDILASLLNHLHYLFKLIRGAEFLARLGLPFKGAFLYHGASLVHKNVLVVGCNDPVQAEIATFLAGHGANVFVTCKDSSSADVITAKFREMKTMRKDLVTGNDKPQSSMLIHSEFDRHDGEDCRESVLNHVPCNDSQTQHCAILRLATDNVEDIRQFAAAFARDGPVIDLIFHQTGEMIPTKAKDALHHEKAPAIVENSYGPSMLTLQLEHRLAQDARVIFSTSFLHYLGNVGQSLLSHFADSRIGAALSFILTWRSPPITSFFRNAPSPSTTKLYANAKATQIATVRLLGQRWSNDPNIPARFAAAPEIRQKAFKVFAYNPGLLHSGFSIKGLRHETWREILWLLVHEPLGFLLHLYACVVGHSPRAAAETALWLATTDAAEVLNPAVNGCYWDGRHRRRTWADFLEGGTLERMWDF